MTDLVDWRDYHNESTLLLKGLRDLLVKFRVIKKVDNG